MTSADDLTSATARVQRRLIPFLFLLYIVAYLDRINVGFAALQMNQALGFSARTYGFGAGIFFLSYVAFEVPSNVILARVGARWWIARIMISWGLVSSATMFVRSATGFYALRFLLGLAEAGFFPGLIYYLTCWFPARERARTIAAFMTATLAAGIIGGPISGALLSLHGTAAWPAGSGCSCSRDCRQSFSGLRSCDFFPNGQGTPCGSRATSVKRFLPSWPRTPRPARLRRARSPRR
jgi:MFS family permease